MPIFDILYYTFPSVTRSHVLFTGSLGNWLKGQPNILRDVVPMMLTALKEPAIAPIAALAFQDVCEDCAEQLSCFSGHLMTACRVSINYSIVLAYSVIIALTALPIGYSVIEFIILQEALSNTSLQKRECTRLIAAICSIICTLPLEQLSDHLNTLAGSRVERLEQLAQQQVRSDVPHLHWGLLHNL